LLQHVTQISHCRPQLRNAAKKFFSRCGMASENSLLGADLCG
jgi:hypothetical protein